MSASPRSALVTPIGSLAAVVGVFCLFLIALWKAGFLSFTGSDPSSKVVAAAIALVGTFIGAIVSAVGLLVKYSIDTRGEDRLKLEAERNAVLQQQAEDRLKLEAERNAVLQREGEDRLKLEAAIRAVQLLATSSGQPSPAIQRSGALFSLASLGQYDLVLSLVFELIDRSEVEAEIVAELADRALRSTDEDIREQAISGLVLRAEKLIMPSGVALPSSIMKGTSSFSPYVRDWIPVLCGLVMAARPLSEWKQDRYRLQAYAIIAALCLAWIEETDERIKNNVGVTLSPLLKAFPQLAYLYHPRKLIDTNQIRTELQSVSPSDEVTETVAAALNKWMSGGSLSSGTVVASNGRADEIVLSPNRELPRSPK